MHTGHYISGSAHGALILWALFGGLFRGDPPEVSVAEVSMISEAQFAAMMQPEVAPPVVAEPAALPEPTIEDPGPETPSLEAPPARAPDLSDPPEAAAEPPAPDPIPEVQAPDTADAPVPEAVPRVAPEARPETAPEAEVAPDVQETVERSDTAEPTEADEQQATAPEAATTEIVTEAEEPARAPVSSVRPVSRPSRPVPTQTAEVEEPEVEATPEPEVVDETDPTAAAIAGALEEALSGASSSIAQGPPLTQGERDGFRIAVQDCWVVDVGSQSANVTVTIGFDMDRSGRVVGSTLRMLASEGGSGSAVETAFQAARRAILRCQGDGYTLPADKYDQWKSVEMTFNPESMRVR